MFLQTLEKNLKHMVSTDTSSYSADDLALFIPKGFAHGYSTITSTSTVVYLQSGDYMQSHDRSIHPESFEWIGKLILYCFPKRFASINP